MPAATLPLLLATAIVLAAAPAPARATESCTIMRAEADPLADRAGLLAEYERLPRQCLETIFRECTAAAGRALLDLGSAAMCSLNYEALLKQGFNGNFHALMAWWRNEGRETLQR